VLLVSRQLHAVEINLANWISDCTAFAASHIPWLTAIVSHIDIFVNVLAIATPKV
jgi:hypothetical protein